MVVADLARNPLGRIAGRTENSQVRPWQIKNPVILHPRLQQGLGIGEQNIVFLIYALAPDKTRLIEEVAYHRIALERIAVSDLRVNHDGLKSLTLMLGDDLVSETRRHQLRV
ncbi:hypothetical protein D3C77_547440 [compost metagenome]